MQELLKGYAGADIFPFHLKKRVGVGLGKASQRVNNSTLLTQSC